MEKEKLTLDEAATEITQLRTKILFSDDAWESLSPQSEQHFMAAISLLEQAKCSMKLADYCRMRAW